MSDDPTTKQPPSSQSGTLRGTGAPFGPPSSRSSVRIPVPASSRSSLRVLLGIPEDPAPIVALTQMSGPVSADGTGKDPGDDYEGGTEFEVRWKSSRNVVAHFVQISIDDGRTYDDLSPELPGDARSYRGLLPNVTTAAARLKVIGESENGLRAFASSRAPFAIERVHRNSGVLHLLSPQGGQILRVGDAVQVRWKLDSAQNDGVVGFEIHLSLDGGDTFRTVMRDIPPHVLGVRFRVPAVLTNSGRLKIVARGPKGDLAWDESKQDLVIMPR